MSQNSVFFEPLLISINHVIYYAIFAKLEGIEQNLNGLEIGERSRIFNLDPEWPEP